MAGATKIITIPIYSSEDMTRMEWEREDPDDYTTRDVSSQMCQQDYYNIFTEKYGPIDCKKIEKVKVRFAVRVAAPVYLSGIEGLERGPLMNFKIVPTFNSEGTGFGNSGSINSLTLNGKSHITSILEPSDNVYIFEYDISAHFADTKNEDYPRIEFRLHSVFCRNFEGVKIVSEESRIGLFMKE